MSTLSGISTVLVANRGEIALRVFRTARALGLRTVAIFTTLDAQAPHVRAADTAIEVPTYLDIDAVVAAAVATDADVVHPGYGFLSERAAFAAALSENGIALAGPSAAVMELMGRKDAAREIAAAAGVPVVPSYALSDDPATLAYPVLVKAAAGGGGKGMRVVRSADEYAAAIAAAGREAAHAFGDDTLLIEKFVESGRHLEVQVLGDHKGTVLHLWERDCSTQRRHQKVLEEAPAPTIDEDSRTRLTEAAVDLAREVHYVGAGTVEFLWDNATGEFYFLEMNTRLQVEHPVTEAITGIDLVEQQLRVAAGQPLMLQQSDIHRHGVAIEARVYAEDAFGGFLPQAGTATHVHWPEQVRVDHALESGQVVSTAYDPMLGKIIVHGPDRERARLALIAALDDTAILGLTTNAGFLRALVASPAFTDATIVTSWLDDHELPAPSADMSRRVAAWLQATTLRGADPGPFAADGFRLAGGPAAMRIALDREVVVDVPRGLVDEEPFLEVGRRQVDGLVRIEAGTTIRGTSGSGEPTAWQRQTAFIRLDHDGAEVAHHGQRVILRRPDLSGEHERGPGDGVVLAPMPGTVLDVRVTVGQQVEAGEVLATLEAMKMELSLKAPWAGIVASIDAVVGGQVALGAPLFHIEAPDAT